MSEAAPFFSVVVPTRGDPSRLLPLLDSLKRQTFPRGNVEIIVSFDGVILGSEITSRLSELGARTIVSPDRQGPGAAKNRAAREATGLYLAFTEDDCTTADDWLDRAAARLGREPEIDVLAGATLRPDGVPSRRHDPDHAHYIPTNLFVRRTSFERVGGYHEGYFNAKSGIYFREDSDFGFSLEEAGAEVAWESSSRVTHPLEHARYLDPLRWARRYEMDALLYARHPRLFRERIEVHRLGPFKVRRLFVRACFACVIAGAAAGIAAILGDRGLAVSLSLVAAAMFLPVWAKWGFGPLRLPVCIWVPPILVLSFVRGMIRRRSILAPKP